MIKKVLITGGTGFLGYHLSKRFLSKRWEVTSLSLSAPGNDKKLPNVKYIFCDIKDKKKLKKKLNNYYTIIINLAGHVDHSNKSQTYLSHFNGCKNLVDLFINKPPRRFIQIGSCIEYGKKKSPQNENNTDIKTYSIYGRAKLNSTKFLIKKFNKYNFPVVILRLYLVYGPNQDLNRLIPIIIHNCLNAKKFECSSGIQKRDFLYVDDLVQAIMNCIKTTKNINGEIINIGSGRPKKVKFVINRIKKIIGKGEPLFGKIAFRKDEIQNLYPDITKAKNLLSWHPKINFDDGIVKTIKSFLKKK